jgi:hypothetical protein
LELDQRAHSLASDLSDVPFIAAHETRCYLMGLYLIALSAIMFWATTSIFLVPPGSSGRLLQAIWIIGAIALLLTSLRLITIGLDEAEVLRSARAKKNNGRGS